MFCLTRNDGEARAVGWDNLYLENLRNYEEAEIKLRSLEMAEVNR